MTWLRKDRIWPTIIISVLAGNLVLGVVLVRIAVGDDHFAVEPDYYRRALAWDSVQQQAGINRDLGWRVTAAVSPLHATAPTELTLRVEDRGGTPIAVDGVRLEARPIAHATELVRATAMAGPVPGVFHTAVPFHREGLWEFKLTVDRGRERFTESLRLNLSRSEAGAVITARPGDADSARTSLGTRRE